MKEKNVRWLLLKKIIDKLPKIDFSVEVPYNVGAEKNEFSDIPTKSK